MLIAGLDEAGRGPVIGPLVIGCVVMHQKDLHILDEIGVDDSKHLSPKKRAFLAGEIKRVCLIAKTLVISAEKLNEMHYKKKLTLNQIEEQGFAQLINELQQKPQAIFLDACDVNEDRFGKTIGKMLTFTPDQIVSKHKGDAIFKIVGAGSIIAKTHRDQIIEHYKQKYGEIGSGYPSDPKTKVFLRTYYAKNRKFPPIVRTWWKTCDNIIKKYQNEHHQKKLTDF